MDKEQEGQEAGKKREEIGQNIHPHTVRVEGGASECCGSLHWQKPKFDYETSPRAEDGYSSSREGRGNRPTSSQGRDVNRMRPPAVA